MKLVAALRIKNQMETIESFLTSLSKLVDEIVIVDNGSTDGTLKVYKRYPKITAIKHTRGFNDGRDRNLSIKMAQLKNPDWIIWIDGDEEFESSVTRKDLEKYMNNKKINLVRFRMFNFWLSKNKFRVDGVWHRYTAFPQRQMFRNFNSAHFLNYKIHMGGVKGISGKHVTSLLRIKHYGYISKKMITSKNKTYKKMEDNPRSSRTMPTTTQGMIRLPWLESKNPLINKLVQIIFFLYWEVIEKVETFKDLVKIRLRKT